MPNPSEIERQHVDGGWADQPQPSLAPGARPARDAHGPIKAGVSFERSPWEAAAEHYHANSRVICRDCAAKDETIRILSEKLAAASECLGRAAERAERRARTR